MILRSYRRADGSLAEMTYVELSRDQAILRLDIDGVFKVRSHLARPHRKSAESVADRWQRLYAICEHCGRDKNGREHLAQGGYCVLAPIDGLANEANRCPECGGMKGEKAPKCRHCERGEPFRFPHDGSATLATRRDEGGGE